MPSHEHGSTACSLADLTPSLYAAWRASELGALTERLERQLVLDRIGDASGKDVLEIGCGDGDLAVQLAQSGARVSAIDNSEAMIAAGRQRAVEHRSPVDFKLGRAQDLPFEANSFDIVIAVTILCFVGDADRVFREVKRVPRPGGRLVIGELGKWSLWAAGRRVRGWFGSGLWRSAYFRTAGELKRLAKRAGLQPIGVDGGIYYPRWTWAARLIAPIDRYLSRVTYLGAAFLVLEARKPK